jgi:hypothetical protein
MIIEHSKVYELYMDTILNEKMIYSLKSAYESYENDSYSFKAKYTVIAELTELQKSFICSNCLTLRYYYSYDRYHRG